MDRGINEQIDALLKAGNESGFEVENWNRADFLHALGNVKAALLYSTLFVPEFVEVEGRVFFRDLGIAWEKAELVEAIRARRHAPDELSRFVSSFNWVEVPYLFVDRSGTDEEDHALARVMIEAWRARLTDRFPDRQFIVRLLHPEETGGVIGVGFEEVPMESNEARF